MITKLPPLAEMLDLMPDAVCVVDAEGHLLFVNASFERIFGYAPEEVLGRPIFDLIHPDDRMATMQQAEQVMDGMLQRHSSEEHKSELQSLMRISYALVCFKKQTSYQH